MERMVCGLRELKFAASDTTMEFEGYGAVFSNTDSYGDRIVPGAFKAFLDKVKAGKADWPAMLSQHGGMMMTAQDMTPVGVWTDIFEDEKGLRVKGTFAPTPRGQELYALSKMQPRPALTGLSIGYKTIDSEPVMDGRSPKTLRALKQVDLIEISPVTFPANTLARVSSVKSIEAIATIREAEKFLTEEAGLTKAEAVALIAKIKSSRAGEPTGDDGPGDPDVASLVAALQRNINIVK